MAENKLNKLWIPVYIFLSIVIVAAVIIILLRFRPDTPVEIFLPPEEPVAGTIYIDGSVAVPGLYRFSSGDSLNKLISGAGGTTASANLSGVRLYVPGNGEAQEAQKVDINRADAWLLETLPGIGETLAGRIVDYRQTNGPFNNTEGLLRVAGIGPSLYERIKPLVIVAD